MDSLSYFNFINNKNNSFIEDIEDIVIMKKMTEEIIEEIRDEVPINHLDNSLFKEIIFQNNVPWGLYFLNGSRSNIAIFLFLSLNLIPEPVDYNISTVIPEIISEMMEEDELWASSIIEEAIPATSSIIIEEETIPAASSIIIEEEAILAASSIIIEEEATPAASSIIEEGNDWATSELGALVLKDIGLKFNILSGSSSSFMDFVLKFSSLTSVNQQRHFYSQALLQTDYILSVLNGLKDISEVYLEDFGSPSDSYVIEVLESQISKLTTMQVYLNELSKLSNDFSTAAKRMEYGNLCAEFTASLKTTGRNFFLVNNLVSNFIHSKESF
jgi:hypothetical protein